MFQVCSVDVAEGHICEVEYMWQIFGSTENNNLLPNNSIFHEQDLRMSVWKSRSVAKKAGLYMEEWLTALRFFPS